MPPASVLEADQQLGFHPAQANTSALGFDLQDFDINDVTDFQHRTKRDLTFVQQTILFDADINEGPEIDDVAHGPF